MTNFTIDDHKQALQALALLEARWEKYDGNNANKYRADIEAAKAKVAEITESLKSFGLLPRSPEEERNALLDSAFPDARSKEIVSFQGKRFMKRFTPAAKSLSGKTVYAWNSFWEEVAE
ncbi:hypothetical protein EX530_11925 [Xanthomonas phaseoli]|uniref:hypothetical protein n=1 Tax=Xanthomonas phaseoli TaxID=1985254 RepID=UPI003B00844B